MTLDQIKNEALQSHLDIVAAFHPTGADTPPPNCKTLILFGPKEPGFWAGFTSSPEYLDGSSDPIDRWSTRTMSALAQELGAEALFPFGGPPYQPFIKWALNSGQVWQSPAGLLVQGTAGLFVSFRGALAFEQKIALPSSQPQSPCETCAKRPCKTACPVGALQPNAYDVAACHGWLDQKGGKTCLTGGCLARRSCPVSQSYGRLKEQSAHHMRAFHKG